MSYYELKALADSQAIKDIKGNLHTSERKARQVLDFIKDDYRHQGGIITRVVFKHVNKKYYIALLYDDDRCLDPYNELDFYNIQDIKRTLKRYTPEQIKARLSY